MKNLVIVISLAVLTFTFSAEAKETMSSGAISTTAQIVDRATLISAMLNDRDSAAQSKASQSLIPYAREPEVKDAFVNVLKSSRNDLTRANAASALSLYCADDKNVQSLLANALLKDTYNPVRSVIVSRLGKYLDNPDLLNAWVKAVRFDHYIAVRRKASADLAAKIDSEPIYTVMLELAKSDPNPLMRGYALDALSSKITSKPELVPIYMAYLEHKYVPLRYYAVKGLIKLHQPSLQSKLVEESIGIINWATRDKGNWDDKLILKGILLLQELDAQETVNALDRLKTLAASRDQ